MLCKKLLLPISLLLAVAVFSLCLYANAETFAEKEAEQGVAFPIVMYHHILKEESRWNDYTISPGEFRQDLEYIKNQGYTPISTNDLLAYVEQGTPLPEKPILITFDDGYESFHEYAYPLLQEYGYPAVLSIVGKYADQYSQVDDHHIRYSHCTWDQLREMVDSKLVEVQNHSYNLHLNEQGRKGAGKKEGETLEHYQAVLETDVGKLQEEITAELGKTPLVFTYPFGMISKESLPILQDMGFRILLTCREKVNYLTGEPEQLYHLGRFNRPHGKSLQSILEKNGL